MLNRLKTLLEQSSPAAEAAVKHGRQRPFARRNPLSSQNGGQSAWSQSPPPVQAPVPPSQPTNRMKYIRYAFMAMGAFYVGRRILGNSDPMNNVLGTPAAAKAKYVLNIEKLDDKIANYQTAYAAASKGIRQALIYQARNISFQRIGVQLDDFTEEQLKQIQIVAQVYDKGLQDITKLIEATNAQQLEVIGMVTTDEKLVERKKELLEKITKTLSSLLEKKIGLELNLMNELTKIFSKEPKTQALLKKDTTLMTRLKNAILGLQAGGKYEFLLEKIAKVSTLPSYEKGKVFLLQFKGDIMASGVNRLREEITAILNIADVKRGDRVVIQLNSPGGTVTGYGLAASQIARLKQAGLHVTVSVDEVAASGGYMMACVADRIVASPFAIIGSIGVVQTMPNFSEALERHGIVVEDVTAGKYKRTMTPYKKTTEEDRKKVQSDLEAVYKLFKDFIHQNRPQIKNLDEVATGEIWHATDAIKKGLIDDLVTTDDLLLQLRDTGLDVYKLTMRTVGGGVGGFPPPPPSDEAYGMMGLSEEASWSEQAAYWLVSMMSQVLREVVRKELHRSLSLEGMGHATGLEWNDNTRMTAISEGNEGSMTSANKDITHRFLAIDPNFTQFPPKL